MQENHLDLFFDDQDEVIKLSESGELEDPEIRSHKKSAILFIVFAAVFPVSLALIWISIPTSQNAALYYFVKLPIVGSQPFSTFAHYVQHWQLP